MNKTEAAQCLAIMAAPFPWDVDDDQAEVWYQAALQRCDLAVGIEVAVRIVETDERFPTPARFNAERATYEREQYAAEREAEQRNGQRALEGIPTPESVRQEHLANMRRTTARLGHGGTRGHDHHGPLACPICGGIAPTAYARLNDEQRLTCDLSRQKVLDRQRAEFGPRS